MKGGGLGGEVVLRSMMIIRVTHWQAKSSSIVACKGTQYVTIQVRDEDGAQEVYWEESGKK